MTALAATDVTITVNHNDRNVLGRIKMNAGVAAFGNGALTYPVGGIPVPAIGHFGMNKEITNLEILDSDDGYIYRYDQANKKLQIYTQAPAIVHEEKHTAVAKAVTLDYPAAWIINVCTTGQNEALSGRDDTLSDHECKLTAAIADGVRTGITTFGASDIVLVTYATQAWAELYALLVQEEAVALTTGNVDLANKMAAFGYCYDTTTGLLLPIDINDSGVASGEVGIKFDSATGQLKLHSDQNGHAAKVTYLKLPTAGTWLHDRWVLDEDPTVSDTYLHKYNNPLLMWGITGCHTVHDGVTQRIVDEAIDPAAGEINTHWAYRGTAPAGAGSVFAAEQIWDSHSDVTTTAGNYITGHPWEVPGLVPLEVKDGTILQATILRIMAWGR